MPGSVLHTGIEPILLILLDRQASCDLSRITRYVPDLFDLFRVRPLLCSNVFLLPSARIAQPTGTVRLLVLDPSPRPTHGGGDGIRTRVRLVDNQLASHGPRLH